MAEEMATRERDKVIELLLDVSELIERDEKSRKKDIKPILRKLAQKPPFKEYGLEENDVKIIAILLGNFFEDGHEEGTGIRDILKMLGGDKKTAFRNIKRINDLEKSGILEIERPRTPLAVKSTADASADDSADTVEILRSTASLTDQFIGRICDSGGKIKKELSEPYRDNLEYLADQFKRVELLLRNDDEFLLNPTHRRYRRYMRELEIHRDDTELKKLEIRISERLARTDKVFPLEEFKRQKALTKEEELIIIALLEGEALGRKDICDIDSLLGIISGTHYEKLNNKKMFQKDGRLIKEKIIEIESRSEMLGEEDSVRLNDRIIGRLLCEKKKRLKLREDDFFEVIKPAISLDRVILHPKTYEEIMLAIEMIEGGVAERLKKWGIKGSSLLQSDYGKRKYQPITMLYYGAPGTGKTLTANAVAYTLKRDLITFDCSKILSMWVGEAEKNTRMIFDRYGELSRGMSKPPVLLLNEADQFLHRRTSARGAADHSYNQMQNIFLEQIEKFDGILIATTNLAENMDTAFSRRFHYKIEFKRPGPHERLKLWRVHMPETAPLSDDADLHRLADRYDLSGGQIGIVVRNAATRAARRGDNIRQEDFIMACEAEMSGNFD